MKKLLIIIPIILIFCGCSDYKELNNIAIVTGIAIDKDGDNYKVSTLISNSKKAEASNKEGNAGTVVYNGKGKNISMALKKIDNKISKKLYFGHLSIVVVSEEIAKEGLDNILDYLFRSPENTKNFYLIMTKNDKAVDILEVLSPLETFPSQSAKLNIKEANETSSISDDMTYNTFIDLYLKKGIEPYLPTIEVYGNKDKGSSTKELESTQLKSFIGLTGLAIFKNSKLAGYATDNESRGINLVNNNTNKMIIETKCGNNNIIVAISDVKVKRNIKIINNKPIYNLDVKASGDIQEVNCDIDLQNQNDIKIITKKTNNKIKLLMNKGIAVAKKYESDIFGFGNMLYKKHPNFYNSIDDWNKYFKNIDINIKVSVNIKNKGSIKQSIKRAKNEKN